MTDLPNLTTSELSFRMKELDLKLLHCLDEFGSDTGIDVTDVTIHWNEDAEQFDLAYAFAFPEE